MPAPVTFDITLAPLPLNFNGTPQQLATAIVQRLTISPAEPWSSFQIGGAIPISDVGPVLIDGQWHVWDPDTAAYIDLQVDGAGILPGTIPSSALAGGGTPNSFFVYNGAGAPASFSYGASGKYLSMSGAAPAWVDLPASPGESTKYPFRAFPSAAAQYYTAGAGEARITLDAESFDPNGVFGGDVFTAAAAGYYQFNASVTIGLDTGTPTDVDRQLKLRVNGSTVTRASAQVNSDLDDVTLKLSDVVYLTAGQVVDIVVEVSSTGASTWRIDNFDINTYFSGFRAST